MIASSTLQAYLGEYHPSVLADVLQRLQSFPVQENDFRSFLEMAHGEPWQQKLTVIACALIHCSPETIYSKCDVRRNAGVTTTLSRVMGISQQAISKKVDQARHYYLNVRTFRDNVDGIVKEVRGE